MQRIAESKGTIRISENRMAQLLYPAALYRIRKILLFQISFRNLTQSLFFFVSYSIPS